MMHTSLSNLGKKTKISDIALLFFEALLNISSTKLKRSEMTSSIDDCILEDCSIEEGNEKERQDSLFVTRTKSLF